MDNSMQDMIARYSRELLEYGKHHVGAISEAPQPTMHEVKIPEEKKITYTHEPAAAEVAVEKAPPVLYEDFQAAGGAVPTPGRVVFGTGANIHTAPQPAHEQWAPAMAPVKESLQPKASAVPVQKTAKAPQSQMAYTPPKHNVVAANAGFSDDNLQHLQNMNAQRVQHIDVNSVMRPHEGRGWLKPQVFASDAMYPLPGARVVVFQTVNGKHYVIYDKMTNSSGMIDDMVLPAPRREFALSPEGMAGKHSIPYATYNLYVEHPDFLRKSYPEISVFDGVDSVKPIILTPKNSGMTEMVPMMDFYS